MRELFDLLYYSFYCLVIKKKNETGEERASFLLSGSISTMIMAFYFLFSIINHGNLLNPQLLVFCGVLIYVINGMWISHYFVQSGRYQSIVKAHSIKTTNDRRIYAIAAMTIFVGSVSSPEVRPLIVGIKLSTLNG
jgi:hypothetical protein